MPTLTVAEKQHWKDRINRRLDKKIEALTTNEPGLMDRIHRQARARALQSLGLAAMQAELDAIEAQKQDLDRREKQAHRAMLAAVRHVPVDDIDDYCQRQHPDVVTAIQKRQAIHEEELLAEDVTGREVLRLRREKENLLDTVWLATSPVQVRELWRKVGELLGEEPTALQKEALAVGPAEAA